MHGYERAWLPVDVMAGLTIWALMVPQALAYAGIAGVPVQNGLYVMPLAAVGYALLGQLAPPVRRPERGGRDAVGVDGGGGRDRRARARRSTSR